MSRRNDLYDAVAAALARSPGSSMQEIATAAGVSRTTLHRAFGDRATLVERVSEHVLADCSRLFDAAGIDSAPVMDSFERLIEAPLPLAKAYAMLLAEPAAYGVPKLVDAIEELDDRFERFFARGQADGLFRPELPPRWLVYSFGSQLVALWWAVDDGFVAARETTRLLRATVLGGIAVER